MASITQYPTGIGSLDQWILGAGGSKVAAVGSNDGDSSYIASGGSSNSERYTFPALPGDVDQVNSCNVYARFRETGGGGTAFSWIFNGSGNVNTGSHAGDAYALEWTAHYSTSISAINAAELGVMAGNTGAVELRCTEHLRITDYVPKGGFFIPILSLFLPVVGALSLHDIGFLLREYAWRTGIHFNRGERMQILDAFRVRPRSISLPGEA